MQLAACLLLAGTCLVLGSDPANAVTCCVLGVRSSSVASVSVLIGVASVLIEVVGGEPHPAGPLKLECSLSVWHCASRHIQCFSALRVLGPRCRGVAFLPSPFRQPEFYSTPVRVLGCDLLLACVSLLRCVCIVWLQDASVVAREPRPRQSSELSQTQELREMCVCLPSCVVMRPFCVFNKSPCLVLLPHGTGCHQQESPN